MNVVIESTFGDMNFKGTNERNQSIQLSGSQQAVSPMEAVLMAAASCSSIDVEMLLKKMRQPLTGLRVEVTSTRVDAIPAVFKEIHLHYNIYGDIKEEKVEKAIKMSMEQYCSVSIMLSKSVDITYSYTIHKTEI